jgi:hypothetical protein
VRNLANQIGYTIGLFIYLVRFGLEKGVVNPPMYTFQMLNHLHQYFEEWTKNVPLETFVVLPLLISSPHLNIRRKEKQKQITTIFGQFRVNLAQTDNLL